ncbi:MAG: hypothetical protein IPJ43_08600 [Saprospiraceae bacterium]|nr:hypothetical protein [Saprospiraceae bacterium]
MKNYCKDEGVELFEFNPSLNFWSSQYSDSRKYFLEDVDSNIALKENMFGQLNLTHQKILGII